MWKGKAGTTQAKGMEADSTGFEPSPSTPTTPRTPTTFAEGKTRKNSKASVLTGTTAFPSNPSTPTTTTSRVPLTISHRGFRHSHPENSLPAFHAALALPTVAALETDIHLTSDSQVLLSHDPTLTRCFGVNKKIKDCTLEYIKTLRTLKDPSVDCATLDELLGVLLQKDVVARGVWVLLDIKISSGSPQEIMTAVRKTLEEYGGGVEAGYGLDYWRNRVKLGVWGYSFVPFCHHLLPGYAVIRIGVDISYARMFWERGVTEFSLLEAVLMGKKGRKFHEDVKKGEGIMCSWTVNDGESMKWCIAQQLDGVVTDEAVLFGDICREFLEGGGTPGKNYGRLGWKKRVESAAVRVLAAAVSWLWRRCSRRGVMWVGDEALKEVGKIRSTGEVREIVEEGRGLLEAFEEGERRV